LAYRFESIYHTVRAGAIGNILKVFAGLPALYATLSAPLGV
jgi:hypothetical protein